MTKTYFKLMNKERNKFKGIIDKEHSSLIQEAQRSIGLAAKISKALCIAITRKCKLANKKLEELDGPSCMIPMIVVKNCGYLLATYKLVKFNLINASYSLIRSIFEGIQKSYVLTLNNVIARNLFEEDMGRTANYVTFTQIRKKLYQGERFNKMDKLYKILSKKAHPTAFGINTDNFYRFTQVEDVLRNIIQFAYFNSISVLEIYWDEFNNKEKIKLLKWLSSFQKEYKEKTITPNKFDFEDIRSKLS